MVQRRDFTDASDIARGILLAMQKYAKADPVNIATGQATSINELVKTICDIAGHTNVGFVRYLSKPSGSKVKLMDTGKMNEKLGLVPQIKLEDVLKESIAWFTANVYNKK